VNAVMNLCGAIKVGAELRDGVCKFECYKEV
jgi:hypothetical protein